MQLSTSLPATVSPASGPPTAQPTRAPPASSERQITGRRQSPPVSEQAPPATKRSPAGNGQSPAGGSDASSADVIRVLAEDHERIAHGLNDVVVRRLFSAGLDLQAALALIGDQHVTDKIERVLGELDLAIRDLRETVFDRRPGDPRPAPG